MQNRHLTHFDIFELIIKRSIIHNWRQLLTKELKGREKFLLGNGIFLLFKIRVKFIFCEEHILGPLLKMSLIKENIFVAVSHLCM
jgi:hypothetical protein